MKMRVKARTFRIVCCTILFFTLLLGTVASFANVLEVITNPDPNASSGGGGGYSRSGVGSSVSVEEVTPTITIGSIEAETGDNISLPVTVKDAKDVAGIQFVIEYNPNVFDGSGSRTFSFANLEDWFVARDYDTKNGRVKIAMASIVGFEDNDAVQIGTLNLKVNSKAAEGDYRITIDKFEAYTLSEEAVDFTKVYGTVTVKETPKKGGGSGFPGVSRGGGGGTITTPPPTPPEPTGVAGFRDVSRNHWAASYIEDLARKGIISGRSADSFEPQGNVTRAEFSKLITAALGLELSQEGAQFSDIAEGEWYTSYIAAAVEAGIVMGRPDGSFGPNDSISRQDMAVMVVRALKLEIPENIDEYLTFEDKDQISDYAKAALAAAVKAGLIRGRSETQLDPMGVTTRAEAATIIHRLMQHLEQLAQAEQSEQAEQVEAAEESEETEEPEQEEAEAVEESEQSEETEETEEVEEVDESDETEELEESDETEESEE